MPKKKTQPSLPAPVRGSIQVFLLNIAFRILGWMLGWLWRGLRPVIRAIARILWPIVRGCLIIIALVAAIIILQQVLARRSRLPAATAE